MDKVLCILLLSLLCACDSSEKTSPPIAGTKAILTSDQTSNWKALIGTWYSKHPTKSGGIRQEIARNLPDGTFVMLFQTKEKDGTVRESKELGLWGVSGNIMFTILKGHEENGTLKPADPSDPYNYDAYRIVKIDEQTLEYEHVHTGNKFVSMRVADNFSLNK